MQAQLGSIIFEGLKGFESFASTKEANYAEHALIEGKPKLQRVGDNLENLQVSVLFDVAFCSPQSEVDALEAARSAGEILPLIMGDGRFAGTFVIKSASVTHQKHSNVGSILQAEVALTLLEFATGDPLVAAASSAVRTAFANPLNNPPLFAPSFPISSDASAAMAGVVATNASVETATSIMEVLPSFPSVYRTNTERIIQNMIRTGNQVNRVLQIINADPASELYERTRDLAVRCEQVSVTSSNITVQAQSLLTDIDNDNTSGVIQGVAQLSEQSVEVGGLASDFMSSASSLTSYILNQ
jgi:phage protein U